MIDIKNTRSVVKKKRNLISTLNKKATILYILPVRTVRNTYIVF